MINHNLDGIDHINIYSKGKTKLGQLLSNFAFSPFTHPQHGNFNSIEGYWYWLKSKDNELRKLYGLSAKSYGKSVLSKEGIENDDFLDPEFSENISLAIKLKIENNPELKQLLIESNLPLQHYYIVNSNVKELPQHRWQVLEIEKIRLEYQTIEKSRNSMLDNEIISFSTDKYLTKEIKRNAWKKAKELSTIMFDRQQEFKKGQNSKSLSARREKIYLGILSEIIFYEYLKDKYPEIIQNVKIEGTESQGVDKYDVLLFGKKVDIKSSKEKRDIFQENKSQFLLEKRNYTLPLDQYNSDKKDYIFQVMYDKDFKNVYLSGFMKVSELAQEENLRELKLNNGNIQYTFMKNLKYGVSIDKTLNELKPKYKEYKINITNKGNSGASKEYGFYIGRGSLYGNPFPTKPSAHSDEIYSHKDSMLKFKNEILPTMDLSPIIEKIEKNGFVRLDCFCCNTTIESNNINIKNQCHGEIIAEEAYRRMGIEKKIELKPKIIGFTGHADIESANGIKDHHKQGYNTVIYEKVYKEISNMISNVIEKEKLQKEQIVIVSGMARGVDEIAAKYAMNNNLPLILSIPVSIDWHKNRGARKNGGRAQAYDYQEILNYVYNRIKQGCKYSNIKQISKEYNGKKYKYANFARNQNIIDESDLIVSYKKQHSTGTSDAISAAKKEGKYYGNVIDYDGLEGINKPFKIKFNTDLFKEKSHIIIQGCNCFNTMGAGIAKMIKNQYPEVYEADLKTQKGDRNKMGNFTFADVNPDNIPNKPKYIVNLYSQYTHWDKSDMFDINAFKEGMEKIIEHFLKERKGDKKLIFSFPAIGLGLANGNINEIYVVLNELSSKYQESNIELKLCLHPKDKDLNETFEKLEKLPTYNKTAKEIEILEKQKSGYFDDENSITF